jgi:hypothetical protein
VSESNCSFPGLTSVSKMPAVGSPSGSVEADAFDFSVLLGPVRIRENASFYRQFSTPALEAGIKVFSK